MKPRPELPGVNKVWSKRISHGSRIGFALIFLYLFIYHYHHESRGAGLHLGDFPTFYLAAEFAREHRDIYTAGMTRPMMYVYPPLIAFLYTPLTALPIRDAAKVSLGLNTLMLLTSVLLAVRAMQNRLANVSSDQFWTAALMVSLLSINELRAVLTMLETDPIMLLMFVLGLYWLDRRPAWAGLALAVALNIKYLSIVALPYLFLRRRWPVLIAFVLGAVFFALLPSALLGWHEDLRSLRVALGGLLRWVGVPPEISHSIRVHDIADNLSVSVTSMLGRVLRPRGISNLCVMGIAGAAGLLVLGVVSRMYAVTGFSMWRWPLSSRQNAQPFAGLVAMEWAGLITAALAFSPDTNTRHLVLAVIVNALAAVILLAPQSMARRTPAIFGTAIILVSFIMPFGTKDSATHFFYFKYGIPGWGLTIGYLMILWTGLGYLSTCIGIGIRKPS